MTTRPRPARRCSSARSTAHLRKSSRDTATELERARRRHHLQLGPLLSPSAARARRPALRVVVNARRPLPSKGRPGSSSRARSSMPELPQPESAGRHGPHRSTTISPRGVRGPLSCYGTGSGWFERDYVETATEFGRWGSDWNSLAHDLPINPVALAGPEAAGDARDPLLIGGGGEKKTLRIVAEARRRSGTRISVRARPSSASSASSPSKRPRWVGRDNEQIETSDRSA